MWLAIESAVVIAISEMLLVSRRIPWRAARITSPARATASCQTRSSRTPVDMAHATGAAGQGRHHSGARLALPEPPPGHANGRTPSISGNPDLSSRALPDHAGPVASVPSL